MRPRWILGGLAIFAMVLSLCLSRGRTAEPVYAGKALSKWLNAGQEDACMAVHEIGPAALPYILAKVSREDPRYGTSIRYRRFWQQVPRGVRSVLPKPVQANYDENRACNMVLVLGPVIIPGLIESLEDRNPVVREVSAHALGLWRQQGKAGSTASTALTRALRDSEPDVAKRAAWALGQGNENQKL